MDWQRVREKFPDQWVSIEILEAYTNNNEMIVEQLAVIEGDPDSKKIRDICRQLHKKQPTRHYLFYHTKNEQLKILVRPQTKFF